MRKINSQFFEEFKSLEKLLNDMYGDIHGVKLYIDDLKEKDGKKWSKELKELIRLNRLRNHLAHDEGAFNEDCVTKNDIQWLENFRNDILKGEDPLNFCKKEKYNDYETKDWKSVIYCLILIVAIVLGVIVLFNLLNN